MSRRERVSAWLYANSQGLLALPYFFSASIPLQYGVFMALDTGRWEDLTPALTVLVVGPLSYFFGWARLHPKSVAVRAASLKMHLPLCLLYLAAGGLGLCRALSDPPGGQEWIYFGACLAAGVAGLAGALGHLWDDWVEPEPVNERLGLSPPSPGSSGLRPGQVVVWRAHWLSLLAVLPFGVLGGGGLALGVGLEVFAGRIPALPGGVMICVGLLLLLGGLQCLTRTLLVLDPEAGQVSFEWRLGPWALRRERAELSALKEVVVRSVDHPTLGAVHLVELVGDEVCLKLVERLKDGARAQAIAAEVSQLLERGRP